MRIEQMEGDAEHRAEEANELAKEAEEKRKQADELCTFIDKLWEAHAEIGSEELRTAIETSQESKRELERGLEEAREKRDALQGEIRKDIERCDSYLGKAQFGLDWGRPITESALGSDSLLGKPMMGILNKVESTMGRVVEIRDSFAATLYRLDQIPQLR